MSINKALSAFISIFGAIVLVGWVLGIEIVKRGINGWELMMPATAALFFFVGMFLYCEQKEGTCPRLFRENVLIAIAGLTCVTLWWQGIVISSKVLGHDEFSQKATDLLPYLPSLATSGNFFIIFVHSLFISMIKSKWPRRAVAAILFATSISILIGYTIGMPVLYFKYNIFNAMAFHSAILFILCGIVIFRGQEDIKPKKKMSFNNTPKIRLNFSKNKS